MTDKEALDFYNELKEWYGDKLVNFQHYPITFRNQVKVYRYYKERKQNEDSSLQ